MIRVGVRPSQKSINSEIKLRMIKVHGLEYFDHVTYLKVVYHLTEM